MARLCFGVWNDYTNEMMVMVRMVGDRGEVFYFLSNFMFSYLLHPTNVF
ncbi:hypothetical protein THOM_2724 [Trachipleistophora hominis]|uniref:Uncharacterized protein n=1 Tax=Trachipleistophora hominis TaxID=72359 RepID=L7JTI7_TRAHO|nr:hypothetical protein THOM_2724 [Trachipleistophora hominis]